jgi:uncharacterized lipoprotein YddW (UPF0748 family)
MTVSGVVAGRRAVAVALLACLAFASSPAAPETSAPPSAATEIRALWVLRTSLTSPDSIAELVRAARTHGFNTLLVQVRGRADAFYDSRLEPRSSELHRQPHSFDPLATVLRHAHAAGLRVHAWVNVNLVSSAVYLPGDRDHLVRRHPEWLMVPRDLAQDLARVDADSPAYVDRLARWTRTQSGRVEGLFASPVIPAAADHAAAVARDLVRRYPVDGIHFDYVRYPTDRFDYSRHALAAFRAFLRPRLEDETRRALDRAAKNDVLAYADAAPQEWRAFRIARMTALMARLRQVVKEERASALVTVAAAPDRREALDYKLQDWGAWLEAGLIDAICPMAYTPEAARFAEQIAAAREAAGARAVWAGIGAYRLTPAQTIENIRTARRLGAEGVVLFSYDSLVTMRHGAPDYLARVARGAFGAAGADAGSR